MLLGVLVLVVVMAVYAGMERNVKARLLGFTPHILITQHDPDSVDGSMDNWQASVDRAKTLPFVQSVSPYVTYNVIVDAPTGQRPVMFHGIDTSDPAQVAGIEKMLDQAAYPGSSADLGIDDRVVISSLLAQQLGVGVGDSLRLYSTRNFESVMRAYKATENPPIRESFRESWDKANEILQKGWKANGDQFSIAIVSLSEAYRLLDLIRLESIREPEEKLIEATLIAMETGEKDESAGLYRFPAASKEEIDKHLAELSSTDPEKMDGETLKGLKNIVLPKEATIAGVYQASQMTITPDLFIPLPLAQNLAGLGSAVQGLSLRLSDPYLAESVAHEARRTLGPDWFILTWGAQHKSFFDLLNQQRVMMYFTLSFIVLVSAFSMMAVMFTVTIQKRREIGVMKALGAAPGQIVGVFLFQGMILGLLGAILGIALGRLVIHFRGDIQVIFRLMGFDPFNKSLTGFDVLPAFNNPLEQVLIGIMAFVLCSLAALVPAFFAARSDAARSLRNL